MNINVFLEKLRESYDSEEEQFHISAIEKRLRKFSEISNMDDISVNDSLVQYWHQVSDPERKAFLVKALEITDQEQFPEVSQHKMKIITHMRNNNHFDEEGRSGMDAALAHIEKYKGSQLRLLMPMLKAQMPDGSEDFKQAYKDTLEFFSQQSKNIKVEQGLASKRIKAKSQEFTM